MAFDEAAHPRGAAGSATGGEFVAGGGGATGKSVLGLKAKNATLPKDAKKKGGKGKGKKGGKGSPAKKAAAVKGVQTLLNKLGFKDAAGKPLAVDGIVGPKTTAAIKAAQRKYGMPATGKLTPELLKKLKAPRMAASSLKTKAKLKPTAKPAPAPARGYAPARPRPTPFARAPRPPAGPLRPPGGG